jgi:hypothetical protein
VTANLIWMLALISAVGAACFYAGWKAAQSYMSSASALTGALANFYEKSSSFEEALDKAMESQASLAAEVKRNTEVMDARHRGIEEGLQILFDGFERAGVVARAHAGPGRQVGETKRD